MLKIEIISNRDKEINLRECAYKAKLFASSISFDTLKQSPIPQTYAVSLGSVDLSFYTWFILRFLIHTIDSFKLYPSRKSANKFLRFKALKFWSILKRSLELQNKYWSITKNSRLI
jgi:hypothetical protein